MIEMRDDRSVKVNSLFSKSYEIDDSMKNE
jgi:hypothetical protein